MKQNLRRKKNTCFKQRQQVVGQRRYNNIAQSLFQQVLPKIAYNEIIKPP